MADPALWYAFVALFALAGLMNLARGLRRTDARRPVNLALAASCAAWALAAYLYRFFGPAAGYALAGVGTALMLTGALLSARGAR